MLRRLALAALLAFAPSLALAQVNSPDFSVAAYVRNALAGNVVIGGNLTVGGIIIDNTNGITLNNPTGGAKGAGSINIAADYYKNGTIIPEAVSAPLTLVAGLIACPTCVLVSATAHGDSAYAILSTDRYVYTNAAFTAARIWTLPAANSLPVGTTIWVQDAQGTVTTTNTLTISRAGADTIDVSNTSLVITGAGGGITFTTDGVSNWGTPFQTVTTGGTGRATLTNHGVLVGAGTSPVTQLAVGATGTVLRGATGADPAFGAVNMATDMTGTMLAAQEPAHTGDMTNTAGSLATTVTKINGVDQTVAWTTYTPTVTASSGTFTTVSATGRYKQIGKTIFLEIYITVTTAGTAAGLAQATLPIAAATNNYIGSVRENFLGGKSGSCVITSSASTIVQGADATGTTFIANNAQIGMGIVYEIP